MAAVLNEHFPARAWTLPRRQPIAVRVRIVWRDDGPAWLDALAVRWTADAVQVELDDPRLGPLATWVGVENVTRRDE